VGDQEIGHPFATIGPYFAMALVQCVDDSRHLPSIRWPALEAQLVCNLTKLRSRLLRN